MTDPLDHALSALLNALSGAVRGLALARRTGLPLPGLLTCGIEDAARAADLLAQAAPECPSIRGAADALGRECRAASVSLYAPGQRADHDH